MPGLLFVMIFATLAFFYWSAGRAAAERAERLGRDACQAGGVQWLDQSVHAAGIRLRRGEDGRLGFERSFRFEYSSDGSDRYVGRMVLRGDQLVSFTGPARSAAVVALH